MLSGFQGPTDMHGECRVEYVLAGAGLWWLKSCPPRCYGGVGGFSLWNVPRLVAWVKGEEKGVSVLRAAVIGVAY